MIVKPKSLTEREFGRFQGMLIMCGVVISWCLIYEWMWRAGLATGCK